MGMALDSLSFFLPSGHFSHFLRIKALRTHHSIALIFRFEVITRFSLPARQVSAMDGPLSIKFFILLRPFRMVLSNPSRALGRFSLRSTFPRLSTLSGIPLFSTNLFRLATILVLLVGLNLYFSDRREYVVFKITEVAAFKSAEEFRK